MAATGGPVLLVEGMTRAFVEVPVVDDDLAAIELQAVARGGVTGHLVGIHRPAEGLEIYAEPHLGIDEAAMAADPAFAMFRRVVCTATPFDPVRCEIGPTGTLDVAVSFVDRRGALVELRARAPGGPRPRPMASPAPRQLEPRVMRFLVMGDFRYLRRSTSDVAVHIDGRALHLRPLTTVPLVRDRWLSARSGTDLLMAGLLPAHADRVLPFAPDGSLPLGDGAGASSTARVALGDDRAHLTVSFHGPLPPLDDVRPGTSTTGEVVVESSIGRLATGRWHVEGDADGSIGFRLDDVRQHWKPPPSRLAAIGVGYGRRLLRRNWSWRYDAELRGGAGEWVSSGGWTMIRRGG